MGSQCRLNVTGQGVWQSWAESQTPSYAVGIELRLQLKDMSSILSATIDSVADFNLLVPQFPHL